VAPLRTRIVFVVAVVGLVAYVAVTSSSARTSAGIAMPVFATLPTVTLTDEHGAAFSRDAFLGKITIVDFIFTSCGTACPLLSAEMERLQDHVRKHGLTDRVRLLSVSVDPERDTQARLLEFATRYHADPALWRFVRGDEAALRSVVVDGMKQVMDKQLDRGEKDGFTILHGTRMVLVDGDAQIRAFYDATDPESMALLRRQLGEVTAQPIRVEP